MGKRFEVLRWERIVGEREWKKSEKSRCGAGKKLGKIEMGGLIRKGGKESHKGGKKMRMWVKRDRVRCKRKKVRTERSG